MRRAALELQIPGRCLVVGCEDGWRDSNLDPGDGCEASAPVAVPIYVDGSVAVSGDGATPETAFRTIGEALADPPEGTRVFVAPGEYEETARIATRDVVVDGRGLGVTIRPPGCPNGAVVEVLADGASLQGVEVVGTCSAVGVHLACASACGVERSTVRGVDGPDEAGAYGVRVTRGDGVRIHQVDVFASDTPPRSSFGPEPSTCGCPRSSSTGCGGRSTSMKCASPRRWSTSATSRSIARRSAPPSVRSAT